MTRHSTLDPGLRSCLKKYEKGIGNYNNLTTNDLMNNDKYKYI